jgi:murein DD-endopeptidase MepM/ murein hydrolase activator NlpD
LKVRAAASSVFMAAFLATSTYGVRLDDAIRSTIRALGEPAEPKPVAFAPVVSDYESRLPPAYTAVDSVLLKPAAPLLGEQTRLTLSVGDGETLAGVLASADVPVSEAQAAVDAAHSVYDARKLRAGQFVTVDFKPTDGIGGAGKFQGFEIQADAENLVTVVRNSDGFTAQQTRLPVRTETHAVRGVIQSSLFESTGAAGVPYAVTAALIRAFSYDVDFQRDIQPGDRFKVMFDTLVSDGGNRAGDVLYAELILSGKVHAIYGVRRDDGVVDFFTRDGKSVKRGLLKTPVDGARLTSGFGMRMHPILGYTRMHKGVDFGVPTGTPIYAAGDGVVEQAGWAGGFGRLVVIRHNQHMETAYGHMSRFASCAAAGQHVHQGEIIGYVGMTGDATGPHLHYEVRKDGSQVNPVSVTVPVNTGLEGHALVAFLKSAQDREQRFAALTDGNRFAAAHDH